MRQRFKTDLEEHKLYMKKTQKLASDITEKPSNSERNQEINSYFEDKEMRPQFKRAFDHYIKNNKKNVRYNLQFGSLPVSAKELIRTCRDTNEVHQTNSIAQPADIKKESGRAELKGEIKNQKLYDFQELVEESSRLPKYRFRNGQEEDGEYYGKAFGFFQYWLPESRSEVMDSETCSLFFSALQHQRDYMIKSLNFKPAFEEKAKIIDELINEESKKLAFNVGLRPPREARLRRELKGSKGLKCSKKWFETVCKTEPHNELLVRNHMKPWMKRGLPSTNALYRNSSARFYNRIYFNVLDGCCKFFRGKYLQEDTKMRKQFLQLMKKKTDESEGMYEMTIYQQWLLNLNISYAICTYSREMQISFNDFCTLPNDMFRIVMKSCLSEYRNLVVKRYSEQPKHSNQRKLGEKKVEIQNKLKECDYKRLNPPYSSMSTRSRMSVYKNKPYSSYDSHLIMATKRRVTLISKILRKNTFYKLKYATFVRIGTIAKHCRRLLCTSNKKRLAIRGASYGPIFYVFHNKFDKTERVRFNVPRKRTAGSRYKEISKLRLSSYTPSDGPNNVATGQRGEVKSDGCHIEKNKDKDIILLEQAPSPGMIKAKDHIIGNTNYILRNYSRIYEGKEEIKPIENTETLPRDPFFFQSEGGTSYALHRYEAYMNTQVNVFRKINESKYYNLGYSTEMFYWIRAYFEEYRRLKKSLPPLSYLFRKTFCPEPYLHFSPTFKTPKLDWMIIKLQDNEWISKSLTFDYVIPMKEEILKKCKSCINRDEYFSNGLDYFTSIQLFKPFKALTCDSCYPDFKHKLQKGTLENKAFAMSSDHERNPLKTLRANSLKKACCGLTRNLSFVRSENIPSAVSLLIDDKKDINHFLSQMKNEIIIIGNIHHTKQEKYKESVLSPIFSASKGFFKKYFGEYLCLFSREQTFLGTLYNYKVVKRHHDYYTWPPFTELMTDELGRYDPELIKAREYVPYRSPIRRMEAGNVLFSGFKDAVKKYYTDSSDHHLTHQYKFLKYKELNESGSNEKELPSISALTELLTKIEGVVSQECIDKMNENSRIQEKYKLSPQVIDDSQWTISDDKKLKEEIFSESDTFLFDYLGSDMSLIETESDLQLPVKRGKHIGIQDGGESATNYESSVDEPETLQNVVAYTTIQPQVDMSADPLPVESGRSKKRMHSTNRAHKIQSEGDKYRRTLVFEMSDQDHVPSTNGAVQDLYDMEDDTDSVSLTYDEVVRHVASISDSSIHSAEKELDNDSSELNLYNDSVSLFSYSTAVIPPEYNDRTDAQNYRLKDIWFHDKSDKLKKHANRRRRQIDVNGENMYPAECALTAGSYYQQLANNISRNKKMHLVLNCWNAHQKRWFSRMEKERKLCFEQKKNEKKGTRKKKEIEKVFWRNRHIIIDDDFRRKVFIRTKQNSYHHEFFKSQFNSIQYWLHKTLVTPSTSKSGSIKEVPNTVEKKPRFLTENAQLRDVTAPSQNKNDANATKEHILNRHRKESPAYSEVWSSWNVGPNGDILDSNLINRGEIDKGDSDDELVEGADFVLGFPEYTFSEKNSLRKFETMYTNYTENKQFNDDLIEEFSKPMNDDDFDDE